MSGQILTRAPRCVKCAGEHLAKDCVKTVDQKPKCCLCEGEHPASFLSLPKQSKVEKDTNTKTSAKPTQVNNTTPAPPKINFWEQRAKNATARQQPNPNTSKKSSQATPTTTNTSTEPAIDIFEQLNSPAVRETFDLLEKFITIAHTIPTNYGRLRAIKQLLGDEINF
ncbi:hypothetical protein TNIN_427731 [Trichonephila inaurata madagascariensis]|uniref:Uncharacterized protein n=1 Tax=Trichonephila inaurata madagascariensis TaxID=2747483 RepID=A0A8X6MJA4_9ARAC|nr:hypothetical protein TNIN_427731 [Trichonephila inaurata madagascariensis]